jgi:hypothetical protein
MIYLILFMKENFNMPSTLNGTRSDTKNFCKCGKHSAYHCRFMGKKYDYCQKKRGGKRENAGRKNTYNEPTTTVSFRLPISKVDEIKATVKAKLAELSQNKTPTFAGRG